MNNYHCMACSIIRAPLMFLASFLGLVVFWVALIALINVVPAIGMPIKGFMDSITMLIWRSEENINFFRPFPVTLTLFYPAVPGLLIKLAGFLREVYQVRKMGRSADVIQ